MAHHEMVAGKAANEHEEDKAETPKYPEAPQPSEAIKDLTRPKTYSAPEPASSAPTSPIVLKNMHPSNPDQK